MATAPDDKIISVREAAQQCGRNPETIRRWIWSGKLPAEKLGNQLFVKRSNLDRLCDEMKSGPHENAIEEDPGFKRPNEDPISLGEEIIPNNETATSAKESHPVAVIPERQLVPRDRAQTIDMLSTYREEIRSRLGDLEIDETLEQLKGNQ